MEEPCGAGVADGEGNGPSVAGKRFGEDRVGIKEAA